MNAENQDSIRNILEAAINKIYEEHGVCITALTAERLDVSTCE